MKKVLILCVFLLATAFGVFNCKADDTVLPINQGIKNLVIEKSKEFTFSINFTKGTQYKILVMQKGIDLVIQLLDSTKSIIKEIDSPNGTEGPEQMDYISVNSGKYYVLVKGLQEEQNPNEGKFDINISEYTLEQLEAIKNQKARKAKAVANSKSIETIDIDNFWYAYDLLKTAKSSQDSIDIIQLHYIDKASGGMMEGLELLKFSSAMYINYISTRPKFFESMRKNTLSVSKYLKTVNDISTKYKEIYPDFKTYKVCFFIGCFSQGLDVFTSEHFVNVFIDAVSCTDDIDLTNFNDYERSFLTRENDIRQQIVERVGHEATHFQMNGIKREMNPKCQLLNFTMIESACDYIAEIVTGKPTVLRSDAYEYGKKYEKEVWEEFKTEMCSPNPGRWLFNPPQDGKPGNLGFSVGRKIIEAYYNKSLDKKNVFIEVIEMTNPSDFLEKSGYDN